MSWLTLEGLKTAETAGLRGGVYVHHFMKKTIRAFWRDAYGDDCLFCGVRMFFGKKGANRNDQATLDHIDSICLGGKNVASNIQVICKKCNNIKGGYESLFT